MSEKARELIEEWIMEQTPPSVSSTTGTKKGNGGSKGRGKKKDG